MTASKLETAPFMVHAQYVRDLSFENPSAPKSLMPGQAIPHTDVQVNLDSTKIPEIRADAVSYEVTLHINATAKRGDETVFVTELLYAVICSLSTAVPEEHHHPLLMIEVPKLAFPFARQILADVTQQGGFPPMLLSPVDFEGLYRDQVAAQTASAA